jgi:hypothetical protein
LIGSKRKASLRLTNTQSMIERRELSRYREHNTTSTTAAIEGEPQTLHANRGAA